MRSRPTSADNATDLLSGYRVDPRLGMNDEDDDWPNLPHGSPSIPILMRIRKAGMKRIFKNALSKLEIDAMIALVRPVLLRIP